MVRSPVEICLGTSPSHAAKSRPLEKLSPVPIAATMALEMIGPMPGTLIRRSHPASRLASSSISLDKPSMCSSSRCQSEASPSMTRTRGKHIGRCGQDARQLHPQEALSLSHRDAPLQQEGSNLIDDASALADQ